MFQFGRFPTYDYFIHHTLTEYCSAGFPHSEISGSTLMCSSPKLIAACRVLHRLLMPRHSPCALCSLTCVGANSSTLRPTEVGHPLRSVAPPFPHECSRRDRLYTTSRSLASTSLRDTGDFGNETSASILCSDD